MLTEPLADGVLCERVRTVVTQDGQERHGEKRPVLAGDELVEVVDRAPYVLDGTVEEAGLTGPGTVENQFWGRMKDPKASLTPPARRTPGQNPDNTSGPRCRFRPRTSAPSDPRE